jgi:hypothetical protein
MKKLPAPPIRISVLVPVGATTLLICRLMLPHCARAVEEVDHWHPGPHTEVVRIDEPDVRQPIEEFRSVRFQPGDRVIVDAGGCVQTGGAGRTWKRYVDPRGPNSNRLYHGLIMIPGATAGLVRIAGVIGRQLTIPAHR